MLGMLGTLGTLGMGSPRKKIFFIMLGTLGMGMDRINIFFINVGNIQFLLILSSFIITFAVAHFIEVADVSGKLGMGSPRK